MADNVAITAGSGTTIATDDVSSVHYQRVKLVDGTLDSTAAIAGDATNGLDVDVTRVPTDPFGANADASSATGSISAKLKYLASTGGPTPEALADDAAFTVTTSKVFPCGFMADDSSTDAVDEGDVGVGRMSLDRRVLTHLGEGGANYVFGGGTQTGTSDQSVMAASGSASVRNWLCWVTIYNSSTTNSYANIKDGSTVKFVVPVPAYGGVVFQPAHAVPGTGNTAWNVAMGAGVTTAYIYGGGYKGL